MPSTLNEFLENALKDRPVVNEYQAGQGGEVEGLFNVLIGWPKDIEIMIKNGNIKGALQSLKVYKTKVIPDLEKALKKAK